MFDELILHGDQIYQKSLTDEQHVVVPIRLPWYRNLAIAVLESLRITIDGRLYTSAKDEVRIRIEDKDVSIHDLCTEKKYKHMIWCNMDVQKAVIALDAPLEDGEHKVKLEMTINLPYYIPVFSQMSEDGVVQGEGEVDYIAKGLPQLVELEKTMKYEKGEL